MSLKLEDFFASVENFPKEGILFQDISPLFASSEAFSLLVEKMVQKITPHAPDYLAGIEARGFPLVSACALVMKKPFVMIRKKGKLPPPVDSVTYALEYGEDSLEMKHHIIPKGSSVVLIDDVLATGGTAQAVVALMERNDVLPKALVCVADIAFLEAKKSLQEKLAVETVLSF